MNDYTKAGGKMIIKESAENYLEAILKLNKERPDVHAIDIAAYLEFSKPSVSIAMKKLREAGYILVDDNGQKEPLGPLEKLPE